jgi:hypothetical protein
MLCIGYGEIRGWVRVLGTRISLRFIRASVTGIG